MNKPNYLIIALFSILIFSCKEDDRIINSINEEQGSTTEVESETAADCENQLTQFFEIEVDGVESISVSDLKASYILSNQELGLSLSINGTFISETDTSKPFIVILFLESGIEGTYQSSDFPLFLIELIDPYFDKDYIIWCQVSNCPEIESLEFTINESGSVGEYVGGAFSGRGIFYHDGGQASSLPFSGCFRVPIE